MTKIKYCPICGNTGVKIDGSPCDCKLNISDLYSGIECLDIPEGYRGIKFNRAQIPGSMGEAYKSYMDNLYQLIVSLRWKCKNALICSPAQTGKSVMAYSAIQELFRKEIEVFPLMDVLELRRVMLDIEYNKSKSMGYNSPQLLYEAPYIFAYIPSMLSYDTFDATAMLIARRVRRGKSTILLYEGTWSQLSNADTRGVLKSLKGNGSLTTIDVTSWSEEDSK